MNERKTWLVRTLRVTDESGRAHFVKEMGDFLRVTALDGTPSNWTRIGGRYLLGTEHVNPTEDPQVLEVASTRELLKIHSEQA